MNSLFTAVVLLILGSAAFAETSLVGTWSGPVYRCTSGAAPRGDLGVSTSESITFTESDVTYQMTVLIDGSPCTVKGSGTYTFKDGLLVSIGKSISAEGPACMGPAELGSSQTAVEVVGSELRQTMPTPNLACPAEGDKLVSVLVKQ